MALLQQNIPAHAEIFAAFLFLSFTCRKQTYFLVGDRGWVDGPFVSSDKRWVKKKKKRRLPAHWKTAAPHQHQRNCPFQGTCPGERWITQQWWVPRAGCQCSPSQQPLAIWECLCSTVRRCVLGHMVAQQHAKPLNMLTSEMQRWEREECEENSYFKIIIK